MGLANCEIDNARLTTTLNLTWARSMRYEDGYKCTSPRHGSPITIPVLCMHSWTFFAVGGIPQESKTYGVEQLPF